MESAIKIQRKACPTHPWTPARKRLTSVTRNPPSVACKHTPTKATTDNQRLNAFDAFDAIRAFFAESNRTITKASAGGQIAKCIKVIFSKPQNAPIFTERKETTAAAGSAQTLRQTHAARIAVRNPTREANSR